MSKVWKYDYASRCDCSDDDNCGCSSPGNMGRSYVAESLITENCPSAGVGRQALNFSAPAVFADNTVSDSFIFFDYISDSYALLVFYLADFSAICPLEIAAFNQAGETFAGKGVKIVAVSVDSVAAHAAWRKMSLADGGIGQVKFPLVSDVNKKISGSYGVLRSDGMAQRATFLIDRNYTIRYQAVYDKEMERNVDETLRIVDKLIALDEAKCRGLECLMRQNTAGSQSTDNATV